VNVVIDHFGLSRPAEGVQGAGFQRLLNLLRRDNVWAKLIGPYRISDQVPRFPDVTPLARAMVAVAPDRLVWGTDWPHPNDKHTPNCGDLADMVADWIPDEAVRRRILVENPVRLYDF
jgi:predicted TIM-barrel fold metal-dependent hydrolase